MSNINLKGWDLMKIMKKKKGFTLIELMIVLAIIAILAVVLIPKATIFKNSAKASGVLTNVNTVQAYLETKTGSNFPQNSNDITNLVNTMGSNFATGSNNSSPIKNPYYNNNSSSTTIATSTPSKGDGTDIAITSSTPTTSSTNGTITMSLNASGFTNYEGDVVVVVNASSYNIYGIDGSGNVIKSVIVNQ